MDIEVDILLAVYNGSNYLQALLDSLINQTFTNWRLLVSDDGSTDDTLSILDDFRRTSGDRLVILPKCGKRLGPCGNFARLLENSTLPYAFFCDHDDVWLPTKIESQLREMKRLEMLKMQPLIVFTDLVAVNYDLSLKTNSFIKSERFNILACNRFYYLCNRNVAVGCSMLLNHEAVHSVLPISQKAIMHDWWCMLVVSARGKISFLNEAPIMYRHHSNSFTTCEKDSESRKSKVAENRLSKAFRLARIKQHVLFELKKMAQAKELEYTHHIKFSSIHYLATYCMGRILAPIFGCMIPWFRRYSFKMQTL